MPKRKKRKSMVPKEKPVKLEKTTPAVALSDYTVFIYGPPKVGKTRLANEWPRSVFIATEPQGVKAITTDAFLVNDWYEVRGAISKLIKKYQGKYTTVIFDTVDLAFKYCLEYCGEIYGFEHPSDEAWGKGWQIVANEILEQVLRLFENGFMPLFVSHSKNTVVSTGWEDRTKIEPTLPYTARRVILPLVDIIMLMESSYKGGGKSRKSVRTINWSPSPDSECGDRTGFLPKNKTLTIKEGSAYKKINAVFEEGVQRKMGTKKKGEKMNST